MKLTSKILFYSGIIALLAAVGFFVAGIMTTNLVYYIVGAIMLIVTILLGLFAYKANDKVELKENPVESKDDAPKAH